MNYPASLRTFLRCAVGRLLLAAAALALPSAVRAAALPYYPAAVLPAPDGQADTGLQFLAANGQGDYLLKVLPVAPNQTTAQSAYYVTYTSGQYLTLLPPSGATNAQINPTFISERAADGSFYVVGTIGNYPDPDTINPPDQTPGGRGIAWHVLSTGAVAVIPLQGLILSEDSAFPDQEQSASPVAINSSGYAVGVTDSYLLGLNAYWNVPGVTCYVDGNVPGGNSIGATNGLDEQGDIIGYDSDGSNGDVFYRTPDGTATILYQSPSDGSGGRGGYSLNALRNAHIGGTYQVPYDYQNGATPTPIDAIVYDIATGTLHDLGTQLPPAGSGDPSPGYASVTDVDNAGDAIGIAGDYAVWLRDRNSGAYTRYLYMSDILSTFSIGNGPREDNSSPHAILDDGTLVINTSTPYDRNNEGGGTPLVELLKPGADPRSAVTSAVQVSGSSYQPFSYQITASNNPTSFQAGYLESGYDSTLGDLPPGLTLNPATGVISGTLPYAGKYVFDVAGVNGQGVGILPTRVTVTVTDLAGAPTINSAYSAYGDTQEAFSYQITATNNPTSFSAGGLPPGLSLDTSTGVISGQPTTVGSYSVTLQAANAVGVSAPAGVNIQINDGIITSPLTATATVDQAFSYQITASGVPGTSGASYYASGLPGGLSCAYDTGLITGTPDDYNNPGAFNVLVSVSNAAGDAAAATVVLTLNAAAPPTPPSITSPATVSATVGQPFSYQITVSGITPTMYYSSYLPDGLTLDPTSGLISGTPAGDNPLPVYNVSLDARDTVNGGDAVGTLTINLAGSTGTAPMPVITSPATATATVGQPFSYQVTVANLTPTYYAAYGLPDGVTINNATGLISGIPAADASGIVFDLQLFVRDDASHTAGGVLSITVYPAGTTPPPTPTPAPTPVPTPTPTPIPSAGNDDLTIATTVTPNPLVQNGLATYHVVVTNHGPDTATGVNVYVDYDTNLTFVAQGSATVTQQTSTFLTVPLADLSASGTGAGTSFDLVFRVTASGGTVACSTSVSGDQNDANIFDNNVDLITTVNGGTAAAHAPTINAPAGGTVTVGQTFGYQITTLGDVAVDTYGATGLPNGLALDAASGIITGTPTADAKLGAASVTLSASNGAGRSTSTRTFTVVAAPTGKTSDVFATLTGLKITKPAGDGTTGKYVFKGSVSLTNQGKKPAKKVAVGLYLSNSPYFSFPAVANDPSLSQVAVYLDTSNPLAPTLALTPAGGTVMTAVLPITLAKAGDPFSTLGPVPFKLKIAAKRVTTAAANYRYLLVVIDPADTLKESNKANNVTAIDLRAQP